MKNILWLICILLSCFNTLYAQLELDGNNRLTLNSSSITGSDFTMGVTSEIGGFVLNSMSSDNIGITGYALDGTLTAWSGFNHDAGAYFISIAGNDKIGITADATQIFNTLKTDELMLNEELIIGIDTTLYVDGLNKRMYFNYDQPIGNSDFVLNTRFSNGFGGMYINSESDIDGIPFYGYSISGIPKAYHYFNEITDLWALTVGASEVLTIDEQETTIMTNFAVEDFMATEPVFSVRTGNDSHLFYNTSTSIGSSDFVLNSNDGGFGGMYVNVDDAFDNGSPFYGYAINGVGSVYHYWDEFDDEWKLFHTTNNIVEINRDRLFVNGSIQVSNKIGNQPEGSIYYTNGHFYGILTNGVAKQLDNTTNAQDNSSSKTQSNAAMEALQEENKKLADEIVLLKTRMIALEKMMMKK